MGKRRSSDRKGSRDERNVHPKKRRPPTRPDVMESETAYSSSAAKKITGKATGVSFDPTFSYCILQFAAVFSGIAECVVCRQCGSDVKFLKASTRGLGFKLNVFCTKCDKNIKSVFSSPLINSAYEINRRFTFVMRLLGKGLRAMKLFCGIMDLPSCIAQKSFDANTKNIEEASTAVAAASMKAAAQEELQKSCEDDKIQLCNNGIIVSGDGTWQKRGFSSLIGVATLIGHFTGKVVDFLVKCAYCKECEAHEKDKESAGYEAWLNDHKESCSANHEGSSGKMECDAVVEMFKRSEELHGVKYEYYVGDGDSKTFSAIQKCEPYKDLQVKKKECIGHVQKRMGSRLRKVVAANKKCKSAKNEPETSNSKQESLGGRGKLTGKLIDELTVFYGLAIRNNIDSLKNMKKTIWAAFYHKISTDEEPQHSYCPLGRDSWCDWQRASAEGSLNNYQHKPALPEIVQRAIKPIYEALSDNDLLDRCLGGFTQNTNESLNAKIWMIAPKAAPGSYKIVSTATSIATATFNDGAEAYLRVLKLLGVTIGNEAYQFRRDEDANRLKHARIRTMNATQEARTARRLNNQATTSKFVEKEGTLYEAGMAD